VATKTIRITCTGADTVDFHALKPIQGDLKLRSDADVDQICTSIKRYGFSFPFFVWKSGKTHNVLDGHGRLEALRRLEDQGVEIPPLPVSYVKAKNSAEAKQKLLRLNSQYGTISIEGLQEFTADIDVDWSEIQLPSGRLTIGEPEETQYSNKITAPIYQIQGDRPSESELYDRTVESHLLDLIDQAADLPPDVAEFLRLAAARHVRFHYNKIAEYYAHAPAEVQHLMEASALVIIDFDQAIENGYVQLSKDVQELYEAEHGSTD